MERELTCIICRRGCNLNVEVNYNDGSNKNKYNNGYSKNYTIIVKGNNCPKGEQYAIDECINPKRTVTSSMRVSNRKDTMVSVKTEKNIDKDKMFKTMEFVRNTRVCAPVKIGEVIIKNIFGTNIIATENID